VIFNFMLATLMIPTAITLIPAYVLMTKLKLINTFWSLVLPGAIAAGNIFLLTQFFKSVPKDLEEAAFIDGASHMEIYRNVIIPLARPALLTVFILQFQAMWNNFLQPLLYLNSPDKYVLNVALSIFQQQFKAQWNLTLVGAMFNAIPVMILFFLFSKYYIEGVAYTGIKG
jgi:ABC-type glycerol-3-phosphate transport system permease component